VRVVGCRTAGGDGGKREFHVREQRLKLLALFGRRAIAPDWNDEVVIGVTVARDGAINHAPTAEALGLAHVAIVPKRRERLMHNVLLQYLTS